MISLDIARRAFLEALAVGESDGRYDILCGGGRFTDFSRFPEWSGVTGPAGTSHAAGKYQFEPATWKAMAVKLDLTDFSPASQDKAAWELAVEDYHRHTGRTLADDLQAGDASHVRDGLHTTWTSLNSQFPQRFGTFVASFGKENPPVNSQSSVPTPAPSPVVVATTGVTLGLGSALNYIAARLRESTTYLGLMMMFDSIAKGYPNSAPYLETAKVIVGGFAIAVQEWTGAPVAKPTA